MVLAMYEIFCQENKVVSPRYHIDTKNLCECWKPIWFAGEGGDIVPIAAWLVMQIFGVKSLQKLWSNFRALNNR